MVLHVCVALTCPVSILESCRRVIIGVLNIQDAEMMEQIDRDVMRTHPGLHFFSGDDGSAVTHREVRHTAQTAPFLIASQKNGILEIAPRMVGAFST